MLTRRANAAARDQPHRGHRPKLILWLPRFRATQGTSTIGGKCPSQLDNVRPTFCKGDKSPGIPPSEENSGWNFVVQRRYSVIGERYRREAALRKRGPPTFTIVESM
jgi:hypothetical protein